MCSFLKGRGDFGPAISALWFQGQLPNSAPVPFQHLSHTSQAAQLKTDQAGHAREAPEFHGWTSKRDSIFQIKSWSDWSLSSLEHIPLSSSPESSQELEKYSGHVATVPGVLHAPCTDSQTLRVMHLKISAEIILPFYLICALYLCTPVKPRFFSFPNFPEMLEFPINQKGFLFLKTLQLWIIILAHKWKLSI